MRSAARATLGVRTGSVAGATGEATPAELMLPVRATVGLGLTERVRAEGFAELVHSLATGAPSGLFGLGVAVRL